MHIEVYKCKHSWWQACMSASGKACPRVPYNEADHGKRDSNE